MPYISEELMKLGLAVVVGGLIGAEREYRDKSAGFRTMIFITLGSTLFTMLSLEFVNENPGRVAANIVTGIGFLGAGAIMRDGGKVAGLTTASTIWLAAALGMGIGIGQYVFALISTALALVVLLLFPAVERWIGRRRERRTYTLAIAADEERRMAVEKIFLEHGLQINARNEAKRPRQVVLTFHTTGHPKAHAEFVKRAMHDDEIIEFHY